ncbi:MAG: hypothetical protein JWP27_2753 [Flaviaesturariibacter sp.]|nr:hypothetical protein [Flaviaesturariibacter sp.]
MRSTLKPTLQSLLDTENKQQLKLNEIVVKSIEEEKLLSEKLFAFEEQNISFQNRVADRVASFGGSWSFILFFLGVMLVWMGVNLYFLSKPFDPYPFILLNLVLSTVAALQAPIIMMSQNRRESKDRERARNDYLVNLKAEIEVRNLHQKIDLLISEQMKTMFDIQRMQMSLMEEIRSEISSSRKTH